MTSLRGEQMITLVRHGMREDFERPDWKLTAKEPNDTPLSARGFRQAEDTGRALIGTGITTIYASPFLRALQTATGLADALDLPIRVEPGLGEWHNPVWMKNEPLLLSADEALAMFPRIDPGYEPVVKPVYPELDETLQVRARVRIFLETLWSTRGQEQALLVSHGSPIGQMVNLMVPGVEGIHLQVASITRIARVGTSFRVLHSGIDHLTDADEDVRFH